MRDARSAPRCVIDFLACRSFHRVLVCACVRDVMCFCVLPLNPHHSLSRVCTWVLLSSLLHKSTTASGFMSAIFLAYSSTSITCLSSTILSTYDGAHVLVSEKLCSGRRGEQNGRPRMCWRAPSGGRARRPRGLQRRTAPCHCLRPRQPRAHPARARAPDSFRPRCSPPGQQPAA